jgi:L-rhamnose isomerase
LALLEPLDKLKQFEQDSDFTSRLAWLEELKGLPFGAVWDYYCLSQEVPVGVAYMDDIKAYEKSELAQRV